MKGGEWRDERSIERRKGMRREGKKEEKWEEKGGIRKVTKEDKKCGKRRRGKGKRGKEAKVNSYLHLQPPILFMFIYFICLSH